MDYEIRQLSTMQRMASRNMLRMVQEAAGVTVHAEFAVDGLVAFLDSLSSESVGRGKVTATHVLVKCLAVALQNHPSFNAHFDGSELKCFRSVNIGLAVATDGGDLIVPVIPAVEQLTLDEVSVCARDLAARSRAGKLQLSETKGATFTLSSVAGFPSVVFATPVVPLPQVGILAVGAIRQVPVAADGKLRLGHILPVSLSFDHRSVNGAAASAFLETLSRIVGDPVKHLKSCEMQTGKTET
ncbi:2-oxo acid dehydrogenase subunit E2 [Hoeflea sp. CAU 1731]